jgi:hypothetical protein
LIPSLMRPALPPACKAAPQFLAVRQPRRNRPCGACAAHALPAISSPPPLQTEYIPPPRAPHSRPERAAGARACPCGPRARRSAPRPREGRRPRQHCQPPHPTQSCSPPEPAALHACMSFLACAHGAGRPRYFVGWPRPSARRPWLPLWCPPAVAPWSGVEAADARARGAPLLHGRPHNCSTCNNTAWWSSPCSGNGAAQRAVVRRGTAWRCAPPPGALRP